MSKKPKPTFLQKLLLVKKSGLGDIPKVSKAGQKKRMNQLKKI